MYIQERTEIESVPFLRAAAESMPLYVSQHEDCMRDDTWHINILVNLHTVKMCVISHA